MTLNGINVRLPRPSPRASLRTRAAILCGHAINAFATRGSSVCAPVYGPYAYLRICPVSCIQNLVTCHATCPCSMPATWRFSGLYLHRWLSTVLIGSPFADQYDIEPRRATRGCRCQPRRVRITSLQHNIARFAPPLFALNATTRRTAAALTLPHCGTAARISPRCNALHHTPAAPRISRTFATLLRASAHAPSIGLIRAM